MDQVFLVSQGARSVEASLPEARSPPLPNPRSLNGSREVRDHRAVGWQREVVIRMEPGLIFTFFFPPSLSFAHFGPQSDHPYFLFLLSGSLTARLLPMGPGNADLRSLAREAGTTNGWVEWYQADLGLMITSLPPISPEFLELPPPGLGPPPRFGWPPGSGRGRNWASSPT